MRINAQSSRCLDGRSARIPTPVARATTTPQKQLTRHRAPLVSDCAASDAIFTAAQHAHARAWFLAPAQWRQPVDLATRERLFDRLWDNQRVITREVWGQALHQLGLAAARFIGDEPYALLMQKPHRSEWFVYEQLRALNLIPEATARFACAGSTPSAFTRWARETHGRRFVVLDDCAFSGMLTHSLLVSAEMIEGAATFVGLVGCSPRAWRRLQPQATEFFSALRMNGLLAGVSAAEKPALFNMATAEVSSVWVDTVNCFKLPDSVPIWWESAGLRPEHGTTGFAGNLHLPSADPFYYELLHPECLAGYSAVARPAVRDIYCAIFAKFPTEAPAIFAALQSQLSRPEIFDPSVGDRLEFMHNDTAADCGTIVIYKAHRHTIVMDFCADGRLEIESGRLRDPNNPDSEWMLTTESQRWKE